MKLKNPMLVVNDIDKSVDFYKRLCHNKWLIFDEK